MKIKTGCEWRDNRFFADENEYDRKSKYPPWIKNSSSPTTMKTRLRMDRTSIKVSSGLPEKSAHPALNTIAAIMQIKYGLRFFFIGYLAVYYIKSCWEDETNFTKLSYFISLFKNIILNIGAILTQCSKI